MEIPGLGPVSRDDEPDYLVSGPVPVPVFGAVSCPFIVEGYEDDPDKEDFHAVIRTFLALDRTALQDAAPAVFEYYQDIAAEFADDEDFPQIAGPEQVWDHVSVDRHDVTVRRHSGDGLVYVSVECECSWEEEHGLQVVFRGGARVTKIGPYDGHLTNASAYARDDLENVVYVR